MHNELYHHGILGQKWGVRRFQNKAGSYTVAGKKRRSLREWKDETYKPEGKTLNRTYNERQILFTHGRDGKEITLEQTKNGGLARILAAGSKKVRQEQLNLKYFDIKKDGKNIGEIEIAQVDPDTINATWLGIRDKERGNGYATAVLMTAISECKKRGYKTMTLEVPGDSPDARHIYEKLGFQAGKQLSEDDVWGGLTSMSLDLNKYEF